MFALTLTNDQSQAIRDKALQTLRQMGTTASAGCPAVLSAVAQPEFDRKQVLLTIAEVCPGDGTTIQTVLPLAGDELLMPTAISTLAALGPNAVPDLISLYHRGQPTQRLQIISDLSLKKEPVSELLPFFTSELDDTDAEVAKEAAIGLKHLGPAARPSLPRLIKAYEANRSRATLNCTFAAIGPDAVSALPTLEAVAEDRAAYQESEEELRTHYYECSILEAFEGIGKASVAVLIQLLSSPHFTSDSLRGLLRLDDVPEDALLSLTALLGSQTHGELAGRVIAGTGDKGFTALISATRDPAPTVRAQALHALSGTSRSCNDLVPVAGGFLRDRNPNVRIAAGFLLKYCPTVRSQIAKLSHDPDRNVRKEFPPEPPEPAVERQQPERDLLSEFLTSSADERQHLAERIERLGEDAFPLIPGLRKELTSSNAPLAADSAFLLSRLGASHGDPAFNSLLLDGFIANYIWSGIREVERSWNETSAYGSLNFGLTMYGALIAGNVYAGNRAASSNHGIMRGERLSGGRSPLPDLPWPVPTPSRSDIIPKQLFGDNAKTLGDAYTKLSNALHQVGFTEDGVFAVPSGFAIVTPVERIHPEDVSPFNEPDRWTSAKLPLRSFRLSDYVQSLFLDNPGQFRLFIFVVTDKDPELSDKILSEKEARALAISGGKILPESIGIRTFADKQCYVLLYHFERKIGGDALELSPSPFPIRTHLLRVGLSQFVQ